MNGTLNASGHHIANPDETSVNASSEEIIARIWYDVLGVKDSSSNTDFFELGGDSVLAVRFIERIWTELHVEVSLYDFIVGPSISAVSKRVDAKKARNKGTSDPSG